MELLAWYNVVFLIPLVFGVILVLGSALGLMGHDAGHDVAADADHDVSHDVGHDVGADTHVDADHDGHLVHTVGDHETGSGHDTGHDRESGLFMRMLGVLGIGRAPLSVVMMSIALLFGGVGYAMNFILKPILVEGWLYGWVSVAVAAVATCFFSGIFARMIAKLMPTTETSRVTERDLLGRTGTVILDVDARGGYVQMHDQQGNLHQVTCRSKNGMLPKGSEVTLVAYVREGDFYFVVASEIDAKQSTTSERT